MQHPVPVDQIEVRSNALNLSLKKLARKAGVNASTAYRIGAGGDPRLSTALALTSALEAEEHRMLAHLAGLHPQVAMEAATVALCPQVQPVADQRVPA